MNRFHLQSFNIKIKVSIISLSVVLIALVSCVNTTTNYPAKESIAISALNRLRLSIDPNNLMKKTATLECKRVSHTVVNNRKPKEIDDDLLFYSRSNPSLIFLSEEKISVNKGKSELKKSEFSLVDGKAKVFIDGKYIEPTDHEFKNFKNYLMGFRANIFFGLFEPPDSLTFDSKIYDINGHKCNKLVLNLKHQFIDGSSSLKFYISADKGKLIQVQSQKNQYDILERKTFNGITLFSKIKSTPLKPNGIVEFIEFESFKLNSDIDLTRYFYLLKKNNIH